ncbi:MAG TPA: isoleucine--tRNA ligase [Bryobacteraceae bacterium]|nr:isoleucine--tRNA ligase [Bryobacteraceae bacterium]
MTKSEVDLKKTVNLPRTDFPMKANLPQNEPKMLERWEHLRIYDRIRQSRRGRPRYVLHDGPPYANGNIHLGHAFNKIVKDFVVKSKTMAGFDSPYVPGWDCHGLPIEIKVDTELSARKKGMPAQQIRAACRKYAAKYVELQKQDFRRLGVFGDWDHPYLTMSAEYQATIAGAFVEFLDKGYVYKGLRPVNWCIVDQTALAEAEVEYENHTSPSIWVRFELASAPAAIDPRLSGRRVYGLIWTTTPWTIPANMAIAYHPKFEYAAVETAGDTYIVASGLLDQTATHLGWHACDIVATFPGERMERTAFRHPLLERVSLGILAEHVTLEQGTGAVHTAPGHGHEDFVIGREYGIHTYCPVDASGRFFHAEGADGRLPEDIIGKTVWKANPIIVDLLKQHGALLGLEKIEHSYPHCWRCHNPTIFRATEQWFIGMDRNGFRERALEAIRKVKWMPAWGEERIYNMVAERPDWCISRQRAWGVPIIVFYCEACSEALTDRRILDTIVDLFRRHTADVWYERSAAELLPPGTSCPKCGNAGFRKESDILDVWFDSGSSHAAVLGHTPDLPWPSELYLEGGDQYRGWFQSSLLVGVGLRGAAPYRECATNGWTLDGEGRAMSKSIGNVIEPDAFIRKVGAEVLRLWVASVEFWEDARLSDEIIARLTEAYRKMRNTFRYALGNLHDFDPATDQVPDREMSEIDRWVLWQARAVVEDCRQHYESFAFHRVYRRVYDFVTTDLSAVYFDVSKDRLYTAAPRSRARRSAQTALYRVNYAMVRLLAPVLSFTCEEAWSHMRRPQDAPESVHLAAFPAPDELTAAPAPDVRSAWEELLAVRRDVLNALEAARQNKDIGASLEAKVLLNAPALERFRRLLPELFIVSQVELAGGDAPPVQVTLADGDRCERCWKYTTDVGSDPDLPAVCRGCAEAVREILHDS